MAFRLGGTALIILHIYVPSVLVGFALGMLLPTIPALAQAFEVAPELAAQAVTAMLIGKAGVLFPAGFVVDHLGRRPAMVAGPLMLLAGVLLIATTPFFGLVLVGQALVGAGEGLWSLGREIAAIEEIRPESRGRVISAFFGISSAGTALGPIAGGQLTDRAGYQAVFAVAGIFALLVCAIALSYRDRHRRPQQKTGGRASINPMQAVAPGYATTFRVLMYSTFCAMLRSTAVQSLLPVYVVSYLGYTPSDVGYLFGAAGVAQVLMIAPVGFLSDKVGRKAAVVPAATLAGVSFVGFAISSEPVGLTISAIVYGISSGLAIGSMTSYTYDIVSADARGMIQAFRRSIGEFGGFSGPILGGLVAGLTQPGLAFLVFAPLHFASALLVAFVARESLGHGRQLAERHAAAERARPTG